jgi:hypothetical protein
MIIRDQAIKQICERLYTTHSYTLGDKTVLDFFAREGDWQTKYIAERVEKIYAWEMNKNFEEQLRLNLPLDAEITMGNSFLLAREAEAMFDIVIFDNPQGCYGNSQEYCEHFEALPLLPNLLKEAGGLVIANIKTEPFNYEDKTLWQQKRQAFYGSDNTARLSEQFVTDFYRKYFESLGYNTQFSFLVERPQEPGLFSMVSDLRKV